MMSGYTYGQNMMWGGAVLGPLFMILALVVAITISILLVRWFSGPWPVTHGEAPRLQTSLDILKTRFARGEIDQDEFETRRRVLGE